jgi:thioredoxin
MIEISNKSHDHFVYGGEEDKIIVLKFHASWCGPCKVLAPKLDKLEAKYAEQNVEFYAIDTEIERDLAEEYGIRSLPTCIVMTMDEVQGYFHGSNADTQVDHKITELL